MAAGDTFKKYLTGIYKLTLSASNSVHYAIIQSIYELFVRAHDDIDKMRLELCIKTASGIWLDYWGDYFAIPRKTDELDYDYAERIIASVIQPKSTIPAIKDNIVTFLNTTYKTQYTREDVNIYEPWVDVGKYSHNASLSNHARFFSQDYWTHATIVISIPEDITAELIDLVNAVKAAGVKVIWSILNSYDIVSDFYNVNDAWAAYSRWIQTKTQRNYYSGLTLSQSSPTPVLSGSREVWRWITSEYQWYAKMLDKDTDRSILITKYDLMGLVDFYEEVERVASWDYVDNFRVSDDGELSGDKLMSGSKEKVNYYTHFIAVTQEMIDTLQLLDDWLTLSYHGRMSTSDGTLFEFDASSIVNGEKLYDKIMKALDKFKKANRDYYNALQAPIIRTDGPAVMWYLQRSDNWLWNTPTMTHEDFFKLWEPFDGEEHTINSIVDFEDAYYRGFLTFGEKYQPPIVVDNHRFLFTTRTIRPWLFNSPLYQNGEMEAVLQRQFDYTDKWIITDPTWEQIVDLEEYNFENYSVARETQVPIVVNSRKNVPCEGISLNQTEIQVEDTDVIGAKKTKVDFTLVPATCNEYVYFSSSNESVLSIDEDGYMTFIAAGNAVITIKCGTQTAVVKYIVNHTEEVEPEPEIEPLPDQPDIPLKVIHTWGYSPLGQQFVSFDGDIDIEKQTIFISMRLDNQIRSMQGIIDVGTTLSGIKRAIQMFYPKLVNEYVDVPVIDTSDNFVLSGGEWGKYNGIPEYHQETVTTYEDKLVANTEDNLFLSESTTSEDKLISGSELDVERTYTSKEKTIIDEPENFVINGILSGANKLSGSTYEVERQYSRHDHDIHEIFTVDDTDNFRLSGKTVIEKQTEYVYTDKNSFKMSVSILDGKVKMSGALINDTETEEIYENGSILSGAAMLSGSVYNKEVVETIYADVKTAEFLADKNSAETDLDTNLTKIAINILGMYINGQFISVLNKEVADVINAIRQSGHVCIQSAGGNGSYAIYREISTYNTLLSEYEMEALTS